MLNFQTFPIPHHGVRLPKVKTSYSDNHEKLKDLCREGFKRLKLKGNDYIERVKTELGFIKDFDLTDYFLLCWQVISYAESNDIPVGRGRGSAAGSLVMYLLGVTKEDPIKHGLFFERFISPARAKKTVVDGITHIDGSTAPDADLDLCYYRRGEVIDFLQREYSGKTCPIATYNTLSSKSILKEVGKTYCGLHEDEVKPFTDTIPSDSGKLWSLKRCIEEELPKIVEFKERWPEAFEIAQKLEGLPKNLSTHASGHVVSYHNLDGFLPLYNDKEGQLVCLMDMGMVAEYAIKLDLLGLKTISVVHDACKSIGIKMADIDPENPEIYTHYMDGIKQAKGIFQVEAFCALNVAKQVKPFSLGELSDVIAIARPGALDYLDGYTKAKEAAANREVHPLFDIIFKETKGYCLYQEQMMKAAVAIGFSLTDADSLRRIVGKKKGKELAQSEWKNKIYEKVKENKLPTELADILWKVLEDGAKYSFNKSHSLCYASLTAITTYLKYKYPKEFHCALLNMACNESKSQQEIGLISNELSKFGIKLLPLDLAKSDQDFRVENEGIRFGFRALKGMGNTDKDGNVSAKLQAIPKFRKSHDMTKTEIFDVAKLCKLDIGALSALIQAGCLRSHQGVKSRSRLVFEAQLWGVLTDKERREVRQSNNSDIIGQVKAMMDSGQIKESRANTIKAKVERYKEIYQLNSRNENLANWYYENKLLGVAFSPLRNCFLGEYVSAKRAMESGQKAQIVAVVEDVQQKKSKEKGNIYWMITLKDETGTFSVKIFNEIRAQKGEKQLDIPNKGDIVTVSVKLQGESGFADEITVHSHKVYLKLKDLKGETEKKEIGDKQ